MLFEAVAMLAVYSGIRVYESHRRSRVGLARRLRTGRVARQLRRPSEGAITSLSDEKRLAHYLAVSTASMGFAAIRQFAYSAMAPASLALYIYTNLPFMKHAEEALSKDKKVDVDVLFFIGNTLTLVVSQYFTATFGVWLLYVGRHLVRKAKKHSQKALMTELARQPGEVWIYENGSEREISLTDVQAGDILVVHAGEIIPVDGTITEGMATIDQRALTGESQPVEKGTGEPVFASTLLIGGRIFIKTEKSGQETTIGKIAQILTTATDFKSRIQLQGEQWANKANLPMLGTSAAMLPILGPVTTTVFLNSHIGNNIRVLAPLGTLSHITRASRQGILVKDGRALEKLRQVDTVLFDKTGTLTQERLVVTKIIACEDYAENEILSYAATAEHRFTHPIAKAIQARAQESRLILPSSNEAHYHMGYGVSTNLGDRVIQIGSVRFLEQDGIVIPDSIRAAAAEAHEIGRSLTVVAVNHRAQGAIEIQAPLRAEAKGIVHDLRGRGIQNVAIVSGDHRQPTRQLAEELGIERYFYGVLPELKAQIVEQFQREGRSVCFVGDGVNDAIAMKKADIAISLRGAATLTTDVADIILLNGDLSHLSNCFDLAKGLDANLRTGFICSLAPGVINVSGAFLFHFSILTSLLVGAGFGLVGVGNAVLPLLGKTLSRNSTQGNGALV